MPFDLHQSISEAFYKIVLIVVIDGARFSTPFIRTRKANLLAWFPCAPKGGWLWTCKFLFAANAPYHTHATNKKVKVLKTCIFVLLRTLLLLLLWVRQLTTIKPNFCTVGKQAIWILLDLDRSRIILLTEICVDLSVLQTKSLTSQCFLLVLLLTNVLK